MARRKSRAPLHVVLLAGGSGTRFWPMSRTARPKQLIALTGKRTLLQESWRRARDRVPPSRLWVAAPARLADAIRAELPRLRSDRLILEPSPRDTGPAVALACATVARADPRAVAAVLPTDHVIPDGDEFARSLRVAADAAEKDALVCLGIRPDRPATGFGYLKCAAKPVRGRAGTVERFVEKPDAARARRFVRSGRYLWNAGMFIWRVERFLDELACTAPAIARAVDGHLAGKARAWNRATKLSVDYAVMEKAEGVRVVPLDAGWDDVGSWDAAARLREALASPGPDAPILVDSPGSVVFGEGRLVAVVDAPDIAVVDTPDALLIVSRKGSEKVRRVVEELKTRKRDDLL
ncbi:MAG: NTP transferase domain-containing protein [bacterium]|nr:NTP transferase domain-containing protein [bacterium]